MRKPVQGPEECLAPTSALPGSKPDLAAKSYRNRLGCHSKAICTSAGCSLEVSLAHLFHPKQAGYDSQGPQTVSAYLTLEDLPKLYKPRACSPPPLSAPQPNLYPQFCGSYTNSPNLAGVPNWLLLPGILPPSCTPHSASIPCLPRLNLFRVQGSELTPPASGLTSLSFLSHICDRGIRLPRGD